MWSEILNTYDPTANKLDEIQDDIDYVEDNLQECQDRVEKQLSDLISRIHKFMFIISLGTIFVAVICFVIAFGGLS